MSIISHLKNLNVVIVRVNNEATYDCAVDDATPDQVYIVEHDTKSIKAFDKDWDKALEKVKNNNQDEEDGEWDIEEVWTTMEKKGWRVVTPKSTTVTY